MNRYFSNTQEKRAVLVDINFYAHSQHPEAVRELHDLALSAGYNISAVVMLKKNRPEPKYLIGAGQAEYIKAIVMQLKADIVIFGQNLLSTQERNLERLLSCTACDRTALILYIFSQRAHSFEGKLQVELAQLNYLSTRLVRSWTHL